MKWNLLLSKLTFLSLNSKLIPIFNFLFFSLFTISPPSKTFASCSLLSRSGFGSCFEINIFMKWMIYNMRYIFFDQFCDLIQKFCFFWFTKHNSSTSLTRSTRTSYTMHIYLRFHWYIEDDYMTEKIYIYPSSSNIGRYQYTNRTVLERCQCFLSSRLRLIPMESSCFYIVLVQKFF